MEDLEVFCQRVLVQTILVLSGFSGHVLGNNAAYLQLPLLVHDFSATPRLPLPHPVEGKSRTETYPLSG